MIYVIVYSTKNKKNKKRKLNFKFPEMFGMPIILSAVHTHEQFKIVNIENISVVANFFLIKIL